MIEVITPLAFWGFAAIAIIRQLSKVDFAA